MPSSTLHRPKTSRALLERILAMPQLPAQVRALPGPALGKLIERVGLEDAGELIALATTEQLGQIFDDDLWRSEGAGVDERFDSGRFVLWLEIFLEAGERAVAERLAELPHDLVTLAVHRHVLVIALDELREALSDDDDDGAAAEKALASCLSEELDDYQLIWRGGEGWDSVLAALLALDHSHHDVLVELLERCSYLSRQHIDDEGGLYQVLSADEMLEGDVSAEREQRRAERGYVAPSAAAGFLRLALSAATGETPFTEHDPLTRGYFRDLGPPAAPAGVAPSPRSKARPLERLLSELSLADQRRPRLTAASTPTESEEPLLIRALGELAEEPELFAKRSDELAYVANTLVAGASFDGRRLRAAEAVEHAIASVSLGLELLQREPGSAAMTARELLRRYPADGLFRLAVSRARAAAPLADEETAPEGLNRLRDLLKALKV